MAVTEQNYRDIADRVYAVEDGKEAHTIIKNDTFKSGGNQFQVLKVEDNTTNGMQAMAVAPVDANGNVDTSQVVIAYAGTNSADGKDLDTDLQSIGGGSKKLVSGSDMSAEGLTIADSQFKTALKFFKQVEKDVKQSHPNAVITTTGHSLGGSLSMYVALKRGYASVTYNGPDIHNMLCRGGESRARRCFFRSPSALPAGSSDFRRREVHRQREYLRSAVYTRFFHRRSDW